MPLLGLKRGIACVVSGFAILYAFGYMLSQMVLVCMMRYNTQGKMERYLDATLTILIVSVFFQKVYKHKFDIQAEQEIKKDPYYLEEAQTDAESGPETFFEIEQEDEEGEYTQESGECADIEGWMNNEIEDGWEQDVKELNHEFEEV